MLYIVLGVILVFTVHFLLTFILSSPTRSATQTDVERIVRRDYSTDEASKAVEILAEFRSERDDPRGEDRVRMAALRLADGNLRELQRYIDMAKLDYRDVLIPADSPTLFAKLSGNGNHHFLGAYRDWWQYRKWYNRK